MEGKIYKKRNFRAFLKIEKDAFISKGTYMAPTEKDTKFIILTFQNTRDGRKSLILSREKVGGTEIAVNENGVRLSSHTRCSKEIRQCIQNSEGEKPNYILKLKLYQACVGEQNKHFQKTKNLKTVSLMDSFLGN